MPSGGEDRLGSRAVAFTASLTACTGSMYAFCWVECSLADLESLGQHATRSGENQLHCDLQDRVVLLSAAALRVSVSQPMLMLAL